MSVADGVTPALGWAAVTAALVLVRPISARYDRAGARHARSGTTGAGPDTSTLRSASGSDDVRENRAGARGRSAVRGRLLLMVLAVGIACVLVIGLPRGLLAAAICCPAAVAAVRYLDRHPTAQRPDPSLPVTLDLAAAVLRSGRPLADALLLAAPAARDDVAAQLRRVAGLLHLGAVPEQAWATVTARDGPLSGVAATATRSASSGVKIAGAFADLSAQLRAERTAGLAMRANRAGIAAMAPLAACYLPSFVCLGVVPAVVGIAKTTLGVLP